MVLPPRQEHDSEETPVAEGKSDVALVKRIKFKVPIASRKP
jgi:hypothetical protein